MPYADPAQRKEANRRAYLARKGAVIARSKARVIALRDSEEGRARLRHYRRAARARLVAKGLTTNGAPRKLWPMPEQRARLRDLMRRLRVWRSQPELRAAMAVAAGKPWNDPSLTAGQRWVVRYRNDSSFRARELRRAVETKRARRSQLRSCRAGLTAEREAEIRTHAAECAYCGCSVARGQNLTLDHIVPLSLGGLHDEANVVPACRSCNSKKGQRTAAEWLASAGGPA